MLNWRVSPHRQRSSHLLNSIELLLKQLKVNRFLIWTKASPVYLRVMSIVHNSSLDQFETIIKIPIQNFIFQCNEHRNNAPTTKTLSTNFFFFSTVWLCSKSCFQFTHIAHINFNWNVYFSFSFFSDFFLGKCHLDIIKDWKEDETTHGIIWSPNVYESGRVFGGAYQIRVPFLQFFEWVRSLFVQSVQQGENREWTREKGREGGGGIDTEIAQNSKIKEERIFHMLAHVSWSRSL